MYIKTENEGICVCCGKSTSFSGLFVGYKNVCSRKCSAIVFRKNLKEDSIKYQSFVSKVSNNQTRIWNEREKSGEKAIIYEKVSQKNKLKNSKYTLLERKQAFSRYYRCNDETIERLNAQGAVILMKLQKEGKTGYMKTLKGKFKPKHPEKYNGDVTNIIFRSSYELKAMKSFDTNTNVLEWSSEELAIPYLCPTDGKRHRYFPDFIVKVRKPDGSIHIMMLEVKPEKETREPIRKKRITKQYITEVATWGKNQAKWKAATEYCLDRGWEFKLITEKELGIK